MAFLNAVIQGPRLHLSCSFTILHLVSAPGQHPFQRRNGTVEEVYLLIKSIGIAVHMWDLHAFCW